VEFNRALASGGQLGPEFGVLALRLLEEARWASFVSAVVAVVATAVLGVVGFLSSSSHRTWAFSFGVGLYAPSASSSIFCEEVHVACYAFLGGGSRSAD